MHIHIDPGSDCCPRLSVALTPGVHLVEDTAVLDQAHFPMPGYSCRRTSSDPTQPAHIRGSRAVENWQLLDSCPLALPWSDEVSAYLRWAPIAVWCQGKRPRALFRHTGQRLPMARSPVFRLKPVGADGDPLRQALVPTEHLRGVRQPGWCDHEKHTTHRLTISG
jgi:hypothetical protein